MRTLIRICIAGVAAIVFAAILASITAMNTGRISEAAMLTRSDALRFVYEGALVVGVSIEGYYYQRQLPRLREDINRKRIELEVAWGTQHYADARESYKHAVEQFYDAYTAVDYLAIYSLDIHPFIDIKKLSDDYNTASFD